MVVKQDLLIKYHGHELELLDCNFSVFYHTLSWIFWDGFEDKTLF